jgi:hypothetical protein
MIESPWPWRRRLHRPAPEGRRIVAPGEALRTRGVGQTRQREAPEGRRRLGVTNDKLPASEEHYYSFCGTRITAPEAFRLIEKGGIGRRVRPTVRHRHHDRVAK